VQKPGSTEASSVGLVRFFEQLQEAANPILIRGNILFAAKNDTFAVQNPATSRHIPASVRIVRQSAATETLVWSRNEAAFRQVRRRNNLLFLRTFKRKAW
jgi:hypothetical protein